VTVLNYEDDLVLMMMMMMLLLLLLLLLLLFRQGTGEGREKLIGKRVLPVDIPIGIVFRFRLAVAELCLKRPSSRSTLH
jgi:hypothetical protein